MSALPSSRPSIRRAIRGIGIALVMALLAGCTGGSPGHPPTNAATPKPEPTMNLADRPTMEAMLRRYRAFQSDLTARLDASFGNRPWGHRPDETAVWRSICDDDPTGSVGEAMLPSLRFDGTYPQADWHRVSDVVIQVGNEHGFSLVRVFHDQPDFLDLIARDAYGAILDFGMGNNTSFGITTGCHRWEHPPAPYTPPPLDLETS